MVSSSTVKGRPLNSRARDAVTCQTIGNVKKTVSVIFIVFCSAIVVSIIIFGKLPVKNVLH